MDCFALINISYYPYFCFDSYSESESRRLDCRAWLTEKLVFTI